MNVHDIGDVVSLWSVFRNELGVQTAPTAVTLTVRRPTGAVALVTNRAAEAGEETLAEAATGQTLSGVTGVYRGDVDIDVAGLWWYRWQGTGTVVEAEEGSFGVRRRRVPAA